ALFADARVSGKRPGRLQILDDRAETDRFGIECFLFCDLRPIQNLEPITLEHFFSALALEHERFASAVRNYCAARGIIALVTASEDCLLPVRNPQCARPRAIGSNRANGFNRKHWF